MAAHPARVLVLTALLALPAAGGDVTLELHQDLSLPEFLDQLARSSLEAFLYVPADLEGRNAGGPHSFTIPPEKLDHVVRFVFGLQDLPLRRFRGISPVTVVLPLKAASTRFAAAGLPGELEFVRPPAAWRTAEDAAGSLSEAATAALLEALGSEDALARRTAAVLLGFCGPRAEEAVTALIGRLEDPDGAARLAAAAALGRIGHLAKRALPRLGQLADGAEGDTAARYREVVETVRQALHPALLDPGRASETAPPSFKVRFETTRGPFVVEVFRAWSPRGADRLYNLVKIGYFKEVAFFRVIPKFMAQFGVHGDPRVNAVWRRANLRDDPAKEPNARGTLTFAKTGRPHSRSVQFFINTVDNAHLDNTVDNAHLDGAGFAPVGRVIEGMSVVDKLYAGYGDGAPKGRGPSQARLQSSGNAYLREHFPELDYIKSASIVK